MINFNKFDPNGSVNSQLDQVSDLITDMSAMMLEEQAPKPMLNTVEPMCPRGDLACGDGTCLSRDLFCDGHTDCVDGSDEGWGGQFQAKLLVLSISIT